MKWKASLIYCDLKHVWKHLSGWWSPFLEEHQIVIDIVWKCYLFLTLPYDGANQCSHKVHFRYIQYYTKEYIHKDIV